MHPSCSDTRAVFHFVLAGTGRSQIVICSSALQASFRVRRRGNDASELQRLCRGLSCRISRRGQIANRDVFKRTAGVVSS